jgi:hypothetical protein
MKMDTFETIEAEWKRRANSKEVIVQDVISYAAIQAIFAKSNEKVEVFRGILMKSFTPWTNYKKIWFQTPSSGPHKEDPFWTLSRNLASMSDDVVNGKVNKHFGVSCLNQTEREQYVALLYSVKDLVFTDPEVVFVWVDTSLPKIQQLIQVAHCMHVLGASEPKRSVMHDNDIHTQTHLVVYDCADQTTLFDKFLDLATQGVEVSAYEEPGAYGSSNMTAFATYPMRRSAAMRRKIGLNDTLLVLD